MQQPIERSATSSTLRRRKMNYPPRKSANPTIRRHMVAQYLQRKQHRYSFLLDGEEDEDTGKEPVGFFGNSRSRYNRYFHDELSEIPLPQEDKTVASSGSASSDKISWTKRDLGQLFMHFNGSQHNIDGVYRQKGSRSYIPAAIISKDSNVSRKELDKADNEYAPTEVESSEDELSLDSRSRSPVLLKPRIVRFADEVGQPLVETTVFEDDDEERTRRLIILLLSPNNRKFEFVHASYRVIERMTLSDIIEQLPNLATNEILANQRYTGLCRVRHGYQELINKVAVQNCCLGQDEVLIAIVAGYKGKDLVKVALPIFNSREIVRAVKIAKRSGRAVKVLQSRAAMDDRFTTEAKKMEEKHPRHVEMPPDMDEATSPTSGTSSPVPNDQRQSIPTDQEENGVEEPDSAEALSSLVFSMPTQVFHSDLDNRSSYDASPSGMLNTSIAFALAVYIIASRKPSH